LSDSFLLNAKAQKGQDAKEALVFFLAIHRLTSIRQTIRLAAFLCVFTFLRLCVEI